MEYSAKIYSRIGELMQGVLPDASAFLVGGLPSRQFFSEAVIRRAGPGEGALPPKSMGADPSNAMAAPPSNAMAALPPGGLASLTPEGLASLPPKAMAALAVMERQLGLRLPEEVEIELRSNIPWGKGLSSSSTDVLSVLSVVNTFLGARLEAEALYRIAVEIEPTDPCLSDDIPIFYQHTGCSGGTVDLPPVALLFFDTAPGSMVDTLAMRRQWPAGAGEFFSWLLLRLVAAAVSEDYAQLFESITSSAEYNQLSLPLPGFADLYRLAEELGAGLVVAHSGTIAGLLVRPEQTSEARTRLETLVDHRRVSGMTAQPVYLENYSSPYHRSLCPPVFPVR